MWYLAVKMNKILAIGSKKRDFRRYCRVSSGFEVTVVCTSFIFSFLFRFLRKFEEYCRASTVIGEEYCRACIVSKFEVTVAF